MGGSESRTLTVGATPDDGIQISQSVYNRLKEGQKPAPTEEKKQAPAEQPAIKPKQNITPEDHSLQQTERTLSGNPLSGEALARIEEEYAKRIREYEKRSEADLNRVEQHFAKTAAQVETKLPELDLKNVCWKELLATNECYTKQPKETLNCSLLVSQFVNCVETAKRDAAINLRQATVDTEVKPTPAS